MDRNIQAYFFASDDPDFRPGYEEVTQIAPDIVLEIYKHNGDWVFRQATNDNGRVVVDLKDGSMTLQFRDDYEQPEISAEFLAKGTFVEVIREIIKK